MVESGSRAKLVEIVAGITFFSQCSLVVIDVAGKAFLVQSQVGAGPPFQVRFPDKFLLMAMAAVDLSVFAVQVIPGEPVVEIVFIKTDHLEFPSVVVVMTGSAFISFHIVGGMISPSGFYPGIDLRVAGEALLIGYLLP